MKYPNLGLKYKKLEKDTLEKVMNSDGFFSGSNDVSSQVGFIIIEAHKDQNASIIDYSCIKLRMIVRSVLGAEIFVLADACDAAITIQHYLEHIINNCIKIKK